MHPVTRDSIGKLILRLAIGGLMLFHGIHKINHAESITFIEARLTESGFLPVELAYAVFLGEIAAPLLIIVGLFTRFGGLLITGNMLFAIYLVHSGELLALTQHGGWQLELQGLYLFCGLAIVFLGGGEYAVRPD